MRRKAGKILLTVVGVVALMGIFAPAASATTTPTTCHTKSGIEFGEDPEYRVKFCTTFQWRLQNDGTGVFLEGMNIWVEYGCNELESHPTDEIYVNIENGATSNGQTVGQMNDCTAYRDLELRGNDNGGSLAYAAFGVNVDTASDYQATHYCDIHPNNPDDCYSWHN